MRRAQLGLAVAVALAVSAGCASYRGGARAVDPARIRAEPGWILAAPTPAFRQEAARDCGAAALAMVAGRWQLPLSVETVARALPQPSSRGIRLGDLRDAAHARGLVAFAIAGDRKILVHELRAGRPVIVGLLLRYGQKRVLSHYEVLIAVHPGTGRFVTIDPGSGWRARTWAALEEEWAPAGRPALVVLGRAR